MEQEATALTFQLPQGYEDEKESSFLVNFTNGQLRPAVRGKPKFTLYQKSKDYSRKKRLIVAETDHMTYIGSNYDPESFVSGSYGTKYCIGELDKEKGTIMLHKTELITLKPFVPGKSDAIEETNVEATPDRPKVSLDHMVSTFGSEKQKKIFSAAKRNRVESGMLESALERAVAHVQHEVDTAEAPIHSSEIIPHHNPLAERPQDVYKLEDIFSLGAIHSLERAAKIFKTATLSDVELWKEEKRYPVYVLDHVKLLSVTEEHSGLKAAILLGLACLMKMHNTSTKAFQKTGLMLEGIDLPKNVMEELLEKFTEKQLVRGRKLVPTISGKMRDKIRLHLLVLTLILDDFTVYCLSLQRDLKLSCTRVMDHFRALGCSVSKKAIKRKMSQEDDEDEPDEQQLVNTCTAILKIPLNFPKPRGRKKVKK